MREVHELLGRRWILKKEDPELYFKLKDNLARYKPFFKEKLGYKLVVNPLLIKLEKTPGFAQPWMGIRAFDDRMAYVFFCLLLMFLEERDQREQFVLAQVTDFIQSHYPEAEVIDWTIFTQRKHLIKVMRYASDRGMIRVNDGDDTGFSRSVDAVAVLYENTGVSKYFMRRFPVDIQGVERLEDFEGLEWQTEDKDRGLVRRHRIYRRLIMEPVVYEENQDDQDYLYIKNQRSVIANDIEKYMESAFHLHQNGAFVILEETMTGSEHLPNRKAVSDIILQMCHEIRKEVQEGRLVRDERDRIHLSSVQWDERLKKAREKYGAGWSKGHREATLQQLKNEIEEVMIDYGMITSIESGRGIELMPACGKITGDYPEDYWQKRKEQSDGTMADQ